MITVTVEAVDPVVMRLSRDVRARSVLPRNLARNARQPVGLGFLWLLHSGGFALRSFAVGVESRARGMVVGFVRSNAET